jgi:NAD+ synthase (glutamine-hydrolysing)
VKIALCQLNYTIADFEGNTSLIIDAIKKAEQNACDLAVFSELSICGYPPDDLLDYEHFIKNCKKAVDSILPFTQQTAVIIGCPSPNSQSSGRALFNSALLLHEGKIVSTRHKTLLPTYDIFDEARYFEPNSGFECIDFKGQKIALTICEDLWDETEFLNYKQHPLQELLKQKPDFIINIAASPFNQYKKEQRLKILTDQCQKAQLPLIYVNQVGAHTDVIFDGDSKVLNKNGDIVLSLKSFETDFQCIDIESLPAVIQSETKDNIALIHEALIFGIRNYFQKMGFTKAILGSSGGIDSAVVQALMSEAIGGDKVMAMMMPSEYSSEGSVSDAVQLSKNLNNPYEIVKISPIFEAFQVGLKPQFEGTEFNLAEENMQARTRAVLLMAMSNKHNYILVNTSNKSEMAVGYTTLYGDMCGSLSIIGDLYKTEVYQLAQYINRGQEIIPNEIIYKAPSAELRPNQKDSDSLPEYDLLDKILYEYIENRESAEIITSMGYDTDIVKRIVKLVNNNEFKRFQAPPILRISSKAFGRGRRIPLVSRF